MAKLEKHEAPWRCDACVLVAPETCYSLPPGTTIAAFQDTATGEVERMDSIGTYGLCAECRKIMETEGTGRRAATLLARRLVDNHVQLMRFTGDDRKRVVAAAVKIFERLLPKLSDPRPALAPESGRAVVLLPPEMRPLESWCPDCGKPMKPGDACHGRTF